MQSYVLLGVGVCVMCCVRVFSVSNLSDVFCVLCVSCCDDSDVSFVFSVLCSVFYVCHVVCTLDEDTATQVTRW